jgi:hypothetical protein
MLVNPKSLSYEQSGSVFGHCYGSTKEDDYKQQFSRLLAKDEKSVHNSINLVDSGYESFLHTSSISLSAYNLSNGNFSSSNSSNESTNTSLFSQPSTPVKGSFVANYSLSYNGNNTATTPDFKQLVADVEGLYYAYVRPSAPNTGVSCGKTTKTASIPSAAKSKRYSNASSFDYSTSNSNSPIRIINSPKFINTEDYVYERDSLKLKLLRSPSFKLDSTIHSNSYHPYNRLNSSGDNKKPFVRSFISRLKSSSELDSHSEKNIETGSPVPKESEESVLVSPKATPTEEEFMQLLYQNKHLPLDPYSLIGSNMGLEYIDMLSELKNRGMQVIVNQIISHLDVRDIVRVASVSSTWRDLIKCNVKFNKMRKSFIRENKTRSEISKENETPFAINQTSMGMNKYNQVQSQKRNQHKESLSNDSINSQTNELRSSIVLGALDMNCFNSGCYYRRYLDKNFIDESSVIEQNQLIEIDKPIDQESPSKILRINRSPEKEKRNGLIVNKLQVIFNENLKIRSN